jgi:hypothetical protein
MPTSIENIVAVADGGRSVPTVSGAKRDVTVM